MTAFPALRRALSAATLSLVFLVPVSGSSLDEAARFYFGGQPERALERYRASFNANPSVEAALNAATIAEELGHHRDAATILDQAKKRHLGGPGLLIQLGWARLNLGQYDAARAAFKEALAGEPNDPLARLGRAITERDAGKLTLAKEKLKALITDQPEMSAAHFYLGETLEAAGDVDAAITAYQNAIKNDSHFLEARPRLAALFEKSNRPDDAWREFVRISYADESNQLAEAGMGRLASRITKKPQEIVPPRRITGPTSIPSVPDAASLPVIRVGIGSDEGGAPSKKQTVSFRTSQP
ncbi:MAG: tetratricopeptide repeat protein, partial [Elusimicrobia bacterium]|nr:tetratricopeptide repeat protein [Elusimicrobiota bacterium]